MSSVLEKFCLKETADRDCAVLPFQMENDKLKSFEKQYDSISKEANQNTMSRGLSTVEVRDLDSFRSLINDDSFSENKQSIIDSLILKMLNGDRVANSVFSEISQTGGDEEAILSFRMITQDQHLHSIYSEVKELSGASPLAVTQAAYWLESEEANNTSHDLVDWYHDCCSFETDAGA